MAMERSVRMCPNAACERSEKKHRYSGADRYCSLCGTELVPVCCDCGKWVEPGQVRCSTCEAQREDRIRNAEQKVRQLGSKLSGAVGFGLKAAAAGYTEASKVVIQASDNLTVRMMGATQKVQSATESLAQKLRKKKMEDELIFVEEDYAEKLNAAVQTDDPIAEDEDFADL